VARQPIFDAELETHAYELLFRTGAGNAFPAEVEGSRASGAVLSYSFFNVGLEELTGGRPAFVNFTRDVLLGDYASLMNPDSLVVELLEDVPPDEQVVAACARLRRQGYRIALDDFLDTPGYGPLIELADIVKIDFAATPPEKRRELSERLASGSLSLLAEKVETQEEFAEARDQGYRYFQGYFFSKPVVVDKGQIPESRLVKIQLLGEMNRPEMDFGKAGDLVKHDVGLTYKLLKFVNSAFFGIRNKVSSVEHAIPMIGERNFRKWVSLLTLADMAEDRPGELLASAVSRARFCELLAPLSGLGGRADEMFMTGMFSFLEAILSRPMEQILANLALAEDINAALLGESNPVGEFLQAVAAHQNGDWERFAEFESRHGLSQEKAGELYVASVTWTNQLLGAEGVSRS
jgi:EAL and modified HD-GYP domain-containing signal transduction protein